MATFTATVTANPATADAATGTLINITATGVVVSPLADLQDSIGDTFVGGSAVDTFVGGSGGDSLRGLGGNDTLNGGSNTDEVRYDQDSTNGGFGAVTVNLATGMATDGFGNTDTLVSIELVRGTGLADTLTGGNILSNGFEGFRGLGGADIIDGGAGFDEIRHDQDQNYPGGTVSRVVVNLSNAEITTTAAFGSLTVAAFRSRDGFGNLDQLVTYVGSIANMPATLSTIEGARGANTTTGDWFEGNEVGNTFTGLRGADMIRGNGGNDEVRYDVDSGFGGALGVTVNLATGTATDGFGDSDTLNDIEMVRGTAQVDSLTGGDTANGLHPSEGFEAFTGLNGADSIDGGVGYDETRYNRDADNGGTAGVIVNLSLAAVTRTIAAGTFMVASNTARDGFGATDSLANVEGAVGTQVADTFDGNNLNNNFYGLGGDDRFFGGDGFDYFEPGAGADFIDGNGLGTIDQSYDDRDFVSYDDFGSTGVGVYIDLNAGTFIDPTGAVDTIIDIERLRGTSAADVFLGSTTANLREELFQGLNGNDTFDGRNGFDVVDYSRDANYGGFAGVTVNLATGIATDGFGATDHLSYIDVVRATNATDTLTGNDLRNIFRLYGGNDVVDGGLGNDAIQLYTTDVFTGTGGTVDLSLGTATLVNGGTATLTSIEDAGGSTLDDTLIGDANNNGFNGWLGNDTISGGAGNDIINGFAGADNLNGGADFDYVSFLYDPTVYNNLNANFPTLFATPWIGISVDLGLNTATGIEGQVDTLANFEGVIGTFVGDIIVGNGSDNTFYGLSGNDSLDGAGGNDTASYAVWDGDGRVIAPLPGVNSSNPNSVRVNLNTMTLVLGGLSVLAGQALDGEAGTDTLSNIENIVGSYGADYIAASDVANVIDGGDGADEVVYTGAQGAYTVTVVNGGYQVVRNAAPADADIIRNVELLRFLGITQEPLDKKGVTFEETTLSLSAQSLSATGDALGNDIEGGSGGDTLDGGAGADSIDGGLGNDNILGGTGTDELSGGAGDDTVNGGTEDDLIVGSALDGFVGSSGAGNDSYDGGSGIDKVIYEGAINALTINLAAASNQVVGGAEIGTDQLIGIENVVGGTAGDNITGNSLANVLEGFLGNDTVSGGEGDDTVRGGAGIDLLLGDNGADTLEGDSEGDQLNGGAGADRLFGGAATDFLYFDSDDTIVDGGADYDYGFVQGSGGVTLDLAASSLEDVDGNAGNDILNAAAATFGVVLLGAGGADQLTGGSGNDVLSFDAADTVVQGGAGTDFAWAETELAAVTVNMAAQGIEIAWGGAGGDTLNAAGVAVAVQIDGKDGNDIITGGDANNILIGNGGADQITGGAVGDQLFFDHLDTTVNGGGGFDYAFVHNALGVTVNFAAQQLEAVFGGFFNDILDASGMASTAYLLGNTGIDQLMGGAADDLVFFDHQDTVVQGGGGYNFAYAYNVGFSAVSMNLATQSFDTAWGGFGNDVLDASGKATSVVVVGLDGADTLTGGSANDTLSAGNGDDLLKGNGGSDTIFGEGGTGDISVYDGVAGDYVIANVGLNVYTITHTATMAVDTLYNVEFARFTGTPGDVPLP